VADGPRERRDLLILPLHGNLTSPGHLPGTVWAEFINTREKDLHVLGWRQEPSSVRYLHMLVTTGFAPHAAILQWVPILPYLACIG
jgi:hypothetical protein